MEYYNKDFFNPDSQEELELALSRTIEEVFDKKEGVFIQSSEFFKKPEGELVLWRRSLEEAIIIGKPRLVCSHCDQMVKLLGRRTERGKIAFFAHLHDSDECDIKTTGVQMTKEEILARKYGRIQESERHMRLKNFIAETLKTEESKNSGFYNVEIEKRINSKIPYLNWRRPDVIAEYKGKKIVFELQLSTTFLGVVVDRDIFYRLNNYFIIWVFNFDDNQEYVNLSNLMCKDIYYANKRNVFILDSDAQEKSKKERRLYLKCRWLDEKGLFTEGHLVSFEDLSFDNEHCKPYYIDADEIYYKLHPQSRLMIQNLEHSRQEIVEGLMNRMNKRYEEQIKWERERELALESMKLTGAIAEPYSQDGLFGYKYDETILVPPYYKEAGEIESDGYGRVSKGRRKGLVNQYGISVVPCLYKEIHPVGNGNFIVKAGNQWKVFGHDESIRKCSTCDEWSFYVLNEELAVAKLRYHSKNYYMNKPEKEVDVLFYSDGSYKLFVDIQMPKENGKMDAYICSTFYPNERFERKEKCEIDPSGIVYLRTGAYYISINKKGDYGLFNSNYNQIIDFQYSYLIWAKDVYYFASKEKTGIIDDKNTVILPFEYDLINKESSYPDFWIVSTNGKWGVVNNNNSILLPIEYDFIEMQKENCSIQAWLIKKDSLCGLVDKSGIFIFPCKYKDLQILFDGLSKVKLINNKIGILLPYKEEFLIEPFFCDIRYREDGLFVSKTYEHIYLINMLGETIFSQKGTDISQIVANKFVFVFINNIWNLYSLTGNLICHDCLPRDFREHEDGTLTLTKLTKIDSYEITINEEGDQISRERPLEGTSYIISEINQYEKVVNKFNQVILPLGKYHIEYKEGDVYIKNYENFLRIEEVMPTDITKIANELYVSRICGRLGVYSNDWRNPIIPYAFSEIDMKGGYFFVNDGGNQGIYSLEGKMILKAIYKKITILSNGFFLCTYQKKEKKSRTNYGRYGRWESDYFVWNDYEKLFNAQGEEMLTQYNHYCVIGDYENGKLKIEIDNEISYIDAFGNLILEDEIETCSGLHVFKLFGKYGLRDKRETIMKPIYDKIEACPDGNFIVVGNQKSILMNQHYDVLITDSIISFICEGKYAVGNSYRFHFCDSFGVENKKEIVGKIRRLNNGYIVLQKGHKSDYRSFYTSYNESAVVSICDSDLNTLFTIDNLQWIDGDFKDGKLEISDGIGKAYLTESFDLLPIESEVLFNEYVKYKIFQKWGVKRGEEVIFEPEYEDIIYYQGIGIVLTKRKAVLYDTNFNVIIDERRGYSKIVPLGNLLLIEKDGWPFNCGLAHYDGTIIADCIYKSIELINGNIFKAQAQAVVYYNQKGNRYDEILKKDNGAYIGRVGIIWYNTNDNSISPEDNKNLKILKDGFYAFRQYGKFGVVDGHGNYLTHCVFDDITLGMDKKVIITIADCVYNIGMSIEFYIDNLNKGGAEEGHSYIGTISGIQKYGLFVDVKHCFPGLVHISKMHGRSPFDYKIGGKVIVTVLSFRKDHKINYELCCD